MPAGGVRSDSRHYRKTETEFLTAQRAKLMLVAGEFWAGATERGMADGFQCEGWAVQEADQQTFRLRSGNSLQWRICHA